MMDSEKLLAVLELAESSLTEQAVVLDGFTFSQAEIVEQHNILISRYYDAILEYSHRNINQ